MTSEENIHKVQQSMQKLAGKMGLPDPRVIRTLNDEWAVIAGDEIGTNSRPVSIVRGVITLNVRDPRWATQIRWSEVDLLHKINQVTGGYTVSSLVVQVRPQNRSEPSDDW